MAECKSCHAPVTWAETVTGKAAPFEIDARGEWVIVEGKARKMGPGDVPPYFTSHFATCKQASQWRRKK